MRRAAWSLAVTVGPLSGCVWVTVRDVNGLNVSPSSSLARTASVSPITDPVWKLSCESCAAVCTEILILFDYVTESPNVNGDDCAVLLLPDPCVYRKPYPY